MLSRLNKDFGAFFRQFREQYHTTGAIAPSSRFLANAQARPLARLKARLDRPVRVLEVGPGTGVVTRRIVRLLAPGDTFDLVEINQAFADHLQQLFVDDPDFAPLAESSFVHAVPLQEFTSGAPYDVIISGLPMNNFSSELVEELFDAYFRLLDPEGTLSYFEYMYMRQMRKVVSGRDDRARVNRIAEIMKRHCQERRTKTNWIFVNLPSAWVQHLSGTAKTESS